MEGWQIVALVALLLLLFVGAAGTWLMLYGRASYRRHPALSRDHPAPKQARMRVTLDVSSADARDPRIDRLMDEAADRLFGLNDETELLEFTNNRGEPLGWRARKHPREISDAALDILEPRMPPHRRGGSRWEVGPDEPAPPAAGTTARFLRSTASPGHVEPGKPVAERFDLPDAVTRELRDRDDPVELVRAILAAAGREPVVDDDVVTTSDGVAVIVLPEHRGADALSHAYFRFQGIGAARAVAVSFGPTNPVEVHRRELLEPALEHVGAPAIQRMADAVALGGDPIAFARGPSLRVD